MRTSAADAMGDGNTQIAVIRRRRGAWVKGPKTVNHPHQVGLGDDLARQIGEAACQTANSQVANVLAAAGSEKASFELIAAATKGAGLLRWRLATKELWTRPAMRLPEIERGDGFVNRLLIGFISMVSRMRLPDAARVAFCHKELFWRSDGRKRLCAVRVERRRARTDGAMVAKWNSCAFCVGTHGAVAAKTMRRPLVDAVLATSVQHQHPSLSSEHWHF
jgi:hypothetical protein